MTETKESPMATQYYYQAYGTFVLSEPGRAVTFTPTTRSIAFHSARPHENASPHPHHCEYLRGDGYCDGSSAAGDKLRTAWEESGHDRQVIWEGLRAWFGQCFPSVAEVAR